MYIYVHIYVCVYTYIYKRYTLCQEILLPGSEIQALSCAGVWAESFARLAHGTSIAYWPVGCIRPVATQCR